MRAVHEEEEEEKNKQTVSLHARMNKQYKLHD